MSAANRKRGDGTLRILVIGPTPPPVGGASLRVRQLLKGLQGKPDVSVRHVETHLSATNATTFWRLARGVDVLLRTATGAIWSDVVTVHLNERGRFVLGPVIWLLTRLLGRPMVLRVFGGDFARQIRERAGWWRWIVGHTICRSELVLVQTNQLHEALGGSCAAELFILPNYVMLQDEREGQRHGLVGSSGEKNCSRFVYLGRVSRKKGIEEILRAARAGGADYSIDIWGPLEDGYRGEDLEQRGGKRVKYRGISRPEEIFQVLGNYHCLLLPTFHEGEGHPAVILEAYCAGLPVIATSWRGIPEIVDEQTGILVAPRDWRALHSAMLQLVRNPLMWSSKAKAARNQCDQWTFEKHLELFLVACRKAMSSRGRLRTMATNAHIIPTEANGGMGNDDPESGWRNRRD